jgi:regulatory protein
VSTRPSADGRHSGTDHIGKPDAVEDWTEARVEAAAVGLLARREHSRAELAAKLTARGAPREQVEAVVEKLAGRGLQADTRYAESLVNSRSGRGQGPVRIRRDLLDRGVAAEAAEEALAGAGLDWFELARSVRRRRFGDPPPSEWKERARQARFLEYRGFTAEQIRHALEAGD